MLSHKVGIQDFMDVNFLLLKKDIIKIVRQIENIYIGLKKCFAVNPSKRS